MGMSEEGKQGHMLRGTGGKAAIKRLIKNVRMDLVKVEVPRTGRGEKPPPVLGVM